MCKNVSFVNWPIPDIRPFLCSCISPLRYCSDFRPYFTIHDSEFKEYTTRTQAPWVRQWITTWAAISVLVCWYVTALFCRFLYFHRPSVVLGVTNPFFAKTLQHWPHIIRIGDMKHAGSISLAVSITGLLRIWCVDWAPNTEDTRCECSQ